MLRYIVITFGVALGIVAALVVAVAGLYVAGQDSVASRPGGGDPSEMRDVRAARTSEAEAEREAFDQINAERRANGLEPLERDPVLVDIARAHSRDLAQNGTPGGQRLEESDPLEHIEAAGVAYRVVSANLAWNNHPNPAEVAVRGWLRSAQPRETILDAIFSHSGVGVAPDDRGGYYFTQLFVQKAAEPLDVTPDDIVALEAETLRRVNLERVAYGLNSLEPHDGLRDVARAHSQDMIDRDYFDHYDPDGRNHADRFADAGILYQRSGENLAMNNYPDPVDVAVKGWMESPGHRDNILTPSYTHTAVGVAFDGMDGFYLTQLFKRPRDAYSQQPVIRIISFFDTEEVYLRVTDPLTRRSDRYRARPGESFDRFEYEEVLPDRQGIQVRDTETGRLWEVRR